jgi:hypothetical protein
MSRLTLFALGAILSHGLLSAATLYSETGSSEGSNALGGGGLIVLMAGWTSPGTYTNIGITALLGQFDGPVTISAYLTTQIGPGTGLAQQIAATSVAPASPSELDLLFSGLTLLPGSY